MISCLICKNKKAFLFHRQKDFSYHFCPVCQTLFLYPQPSTTYLKQYYQTEFKFLPAYKNKKRIRQQAKKIINNLIKLNPQGKELLDIGSGYGYLLEEAVKKGLIATAIEPASHLAKKTSIKHLIKVFNLEFDEFYRRYKKMRFDFIVLSHVIEHLKNPQKTIANASSFLNKNGILYIETPNLNSHLFKTEQKDYTFLTPPEHLWIFSSKSFQKIFEEKKQLTVKKISTYSYPQHLMSVVKRKLIRKRKELKIDNYLSTSNHPPPTSLKRKFKYMIFDQILAPLFTPILNIKNQGSILEIYIKKI